MTNKNHVSNKSKFLKDQEERKKKYFLKIKNNHGVPPKFPLVPDRVAWSPLQYPFFSLLQQ